jgi:hypothetical protein
MTLPSNASIATHPPSNSTYLTDKTVIWSDGTTETCQIDQFGAIYLNGTLVKPVTFMITGEVPNIEAGGNAFWEISDAEANAVLDYIQNTLKQRFIALTIMNFAWWDRHKQALVDFWFPKLYEHKMWVFLWLAQLSQEGTDENWDNPYTTEVESYDGSSGKGYLHPPQLEADWWKHKLLMVTENPSWSTELRNRYSSMVVSVCAAWEPELYNSFSSGYTSIGPWVRDFVALIRPILESSRIGKVALIHKLTGGSDRENADVDVYADVTAPDLYIEGHPSSTYDGDGDGVGDPLGFVRKRMWGTGNDGVIKRLMENYRAQVDPSYAKIPWTNWKTWFPETNLCWGAGSISPWTDGWTSSTGIQAFREWVGSAQFGMAAIWTLGPMAGDVMGYRAFDTGGTPRPWLQTLAPYFPQT